MIVKVSKVFAKAVNEIAEKYGKRFHAEVRNRKAPDWDCCGVDYDWSKDEVRELVVSYPDDYYACPAVFRTDMIVAEYNRRKVSSWEQFERMIIDLFEI